MSAYENIFDAAKEGTIEDVRYFLEKKGVDVNTKGPHDFTPLHAAAKNTEVAKFLISKGADIRATDKVGFTPLTMAAFAENIELAKILISAGADVNAKGQSGDTPLTTTIYKGNVEIAKFLISKGANVNVKTHNGTPLHIAAQSGHIELVKILALEHSDRGQAYSDEGKYDLAIEEYTEAIKGIPAASFYGLRGCAYFDKRNIDLAIADFEAALRIDPDNEAAKNMLKTIKQARGS